MNRTYKTGSYGYRAFPPVKALLFFCSFLLITSVDSIAQVINNAGANINIRSGTVVVSGDAMNSSGTITNGGNINLSGSFSNTATTYGSTGFFRIGGNWNNTGVFNYENSTVIFNGSNNQNITTSADEAFYNLTLENFGNSGVNHLSMNHNVIVNRILTMSRGIINTGVNKLFLYYSVPGALNYTSSSRSRILGRFERGVSETGTYLFPLGTTDHYNPANLTTNSLPVSGTIISQFLTPPSIDSTGLPYDDPPDQVARVYQDGYWLLTATGTFSINDYSINLKAAGFTFDTIRDVTRLITRTGTDWAPDGTHKPASDSIVYRDNLTKGISGGSGTQYGLGQPRPRILDHPHDTAFCEGTNAYFSIRASATRTMRYTWYKVGEGLIAGPQIIPVLIIPNVDTLDTGDYYCIVTDDYGYSTRSNNARLTVNKRPLITIPADQNHECSNVPFAPVLITETRKVTGSFYAWSRNNPSGFTTILPVNDTVWTYAGGSITGSFHNTTDKYDTVRFFITPIGPGYTACKGPAVTHKVVINPVPKVVPVNSKPAICDSTKTDIVLTSPSLFSSGFINFDFTASATGGADLIGNTGSETDRIKDYPIRRLYENNSDTIQVVTYYITPNMDNDLCPVGPVDSQKVRVHAIPLQSIIVTNALTCQGGSNGALYADISKGASPYTIRWQGPGLDKYQQMISNLRAGLYQATVNDNLGCKAVDDTTLSGAYLAPFMEVRKVVSCPGGSDGVLQTTIDPSTTGLPPFTYWIINSERDTVTNKAGRIISNLGGFRRDSNLVADDYRLLIRDFNGCQDTIQESTVIQPNPIRITFDSSIFAGGYNITCRGYNDGWAKAKTITGGNLGTFTYKWTPVSGSFTSPDNTNRIDGCTAGTFRLEVWDSKGCYMVDSVKLIEPLGLNLAGYERSFSRDSVFNISCNGGSDGYIKLEITGGSGSYNYSWIKQGDPSFTSSNRDISNLKAGTYVVAITDVANASCELRLPPLSTLPQFTLNEPDLLTAGAAITSPVNCHGETGSVDLTVTGGSINRYRYNWTTEDGSGIAAGQQDQNALTAGTYNVVVIDTNHCTASVNVTLSQPELLTISLAPVHITCQSAPAFNNGSVDLSVNGGVTPYTYLWSDGAVTEDISGLTGDYYKVTVTDFNGCQRTDSVSINLPPDVTFTSTLSDFNGMNISCSGLSNGAISIATTSGDPPYSFSWTGPDGFISSSQNISGLKAGQYDLLITDINSCTAAGSFTLTEPGELYMNYSTSSSLDGNYNINCAGESTGSITIDPVNQVEGVTYLWSDGFTDKTRTGLLAGTFKVIVLDQNNCHADTTITLIEPDSIKIEFLVNQAFCPDSPDGAITVTASGGVVSGDYSYRWSDGSTGNGKANILQGLYKVFVTDLNNCVAADSVEMVPMNETCLVIPNAISPNDDNINDIWNIGMIHLYPDIEIKIYNRWGENVWRSEKGYPDPWDGRSNGIRLPIDSYHYIIDLHNGSKPIVGNITIVR